MTYHSGKRFVHRDLAARNVLVSEKCVCKVSACCYNQMIHVHNYTYYYGCLNYDTLLTGRLSVLLCVGLSSNRSIIELSQLSPS